MSNVEYEGHLCKLCGFPMPEGEEMFKYHGYSGPCPNPVSSKKGEYLMTEKCKQPTTHHYVPSPVLSTVKTEDKLSWVCVNCGDVIYAPFIEKQ